MHEFISTLETVNIFTNIKHKTNKNELVMQLVLTRN
jgi:hypothetical protein